MEPLRTCIKEIIELRELEKSQDQKYEYMDSDSDTESVESDSDELTEQPDPSTQLYPDCRRTSLVVAPCRDDKYFEAIYKVIDMSPKDDIYGVFGKNIACQMRNIAKINENHTKTIMCYLDEEMSRLKQHCTRMHVTGHALQNRDDSIVPDIYPD